MQSGGDVHMLDATCSFCHLPTYEAVYVVFCPVGSTRYVLMLCLDREWMELGVTDDNAMCSFGDVEMMLSWKKCPL